jgi:glycerophosphoryl diester phosphodiesterase
MRKATRLGLVTALIACAGLAALQGLPKHSPVDIAPYNGMTLIAHAGGGIAQGTYSNTLEALNAAEGNNFTFIELDFSNTENGDLVLIHDWNLRHFQYYSRLSFLPAGVKRSINRPAKSAQKFKKRRMKFGLTQMDLTDLLAWLSDKPHIRIVTDIKHENINSLRTIFERSDRAAAQFIPQIYTQEEYQSVVDIGYTDIIFTNYRARLSDTELLSFMETHTLFGLTVPLEAARPALIKGAKELGIPVFVHKFLDSTPASIVNSPEGADTLLARQIDGVYTDYLYPADPSPSPEALPKPL